MLKVSLLFLLLISSCASFHAKKVTFKEKFSPKDLLRTSSVEVRIHHKYFFAHGGYSHHFEHYPYPSNGIKNIDGFTVCKTDPCPSKKERTVLIDLYFGRASDISALLSGLTLTIIPSKETEIFYVRALVLNEEGQILKQYEFNDEIAVWYQLFFLFALPFRDTDFRDKVANNMVNEVLVRSTKDGFL